MKTYFIKNNYIPRLNNKDFDDTPMKDEWQREVYEFAEKVVKENNFQSILDVGTGSGYKLIKHFNNYKTLGIDIPSTVKYLREEYPTKDWTDQFQPVSDFDLIISSDVIEHIPDPDLLLDLIIQSSPKLIVLSTPERTLMYNKEHNGPPKNQAHVREWNMEEFRNYINSKLEVLDHFISNNKQATQVILAKLK
jgi:SAM-dependent methyltransferase